MTHRLFTRYHSRHSLAFPRIAAAGLAILLLAAAPRPAAAGVVDYLRDRGEDFLDIFRLRYVVPYRAEGYGAKARVTALAQVGFVHVNGDAYGMDRRAIGHNTEKRTEGGVSLIYGSVTEMQKQWGNQYLDPVTAWSRAAARGIVRQGGNWDDGRRHPLSVGAEVELGLFGLDVGVYPTEALDFVTGFLFFDLYKDDRSFTDRLPEFGTEDAEAAREAQTAAEKAAREAAPSTTLLPQEPVAPEDTTALPEEESIAPQSQPAEPTDPTLGSEFVSPQDVEEFRNSEPAPGMQTFDTPLPEESQPESTPPVEPAPAPETQDSPGAPMI